MPQLLLTLVNIRIFLPWILGGLRRGTLSYPFKPTLEGTACLAKGWPAENISMLHEHLQEDSGLILKEFALNLPPARMDLRKIQCPTLCVAGLWDEVSPPKAGWHFYPEVYTAVAVSLVFFVYSIVRMIQAMLARTEMAFVSFIGLCPYPIALFNSFFIELRKRCAKRRTLTLEPETLVFVFSDGVS